MRLAIVFCGLALVTSPAFAQTRNGLMSAPSPEPMMMEIAARNGATPIKASKATSKEADKQLDRQVNATQLLIQKEEQKLQAQFAQLDKMRNVAIDKQNQKELERIQRLEQQVVVAYQKRVEQILAGAQAQIQSTTVHVQPDQAQQPTKAQSTKSTRPQTRATQTGQARTQSTATRQPTNQQTRQPAQKSTQPKSSSRSWWFGRR